VFVDMRVQWQRRHHMMKQSEGRTWHWINKQLKVIYTSTIQERWVVKIQWFQYWFIREQVRLGIIKEESTIRAEMILIYTNVNNTSTLGSCNGEKVYWHLNGSLVSIKQSNKKDEVMGNETVIETYLNRVWKLARTC